VLALACACLLSGCAALVYQVVWTRQISLVMGTTVEAVATVVATFMGGLAAGSALAARFADARERRWLARRYALLEGGIAALALLVPLLALGARPLLAALYRPEAPGSAALALARFGIAVLALLPPTLLMGATLPFLIALAAPAPGRVGAVSGFLYALNTVGAVAGALGCALVLLPGLGLRGATLAGVAMNLAAGALVFALGPRAPDAAPAPEPKPKAKKQKRRELETATQASLPLGVVLAAAALTGFVGLANEVAWTRALILLIGPTAYAFAFILAAVVAGLALGSALGAAVLARARQPALALFGVLALAGLLELAVVHSIGASVLEVGEFVKRHVDDATGLLRGQLLWVLSLLVPPMALSGATFPLLTRLASERIAGAARPAGLVLAWNTLGAIFGSLLAAFWLMPWLGLERTLLSLALLQLATGLLALLCAPWPLAPRLLLVAAAVLAFTVGFRKREPWDAELLSGGVYKYAPYAGAGGVEAAVRSGELLYYAEGRAATVSVKRLGGTLSLAVDGKVDATSSGDMLTQRLLAHVPLLLHPKPKSALVIGLGSGVTAGAALSHPLLRVDAVEISAEVASAARRFFAKVNKRALDDPRLRLLVSDGRNHVALTRERYDVIISEPSNPWMAGVSALFTRDFFQLARERLAPGGLFCQWAHVYNMSERDLKTVVASFQDAFPGAALFLINEGDVLLVGGAGGDSLRLDAAELARRMQEGRVGEDLAEVHVRSPFAFASLLTLPPDALARFALGADRHTDDRPLLEFRAPRQIHANTGRQNALRLVAEGAKSERPEPWRSLVREPTAAQLAERALMLERSEGFAWAALVYLEALAKDPRLLAALEGFVRASLRSGGEAEAERVLRELVPQAPVDARVALALLLDNLGRTKDALATLEAALQLDQRHRRALLLAAELHEQAGNLDAVELLVNAALRAHPGDAEAEALRASLRLAKGDLEGAIATAEGVLARAPKEARALEVAAIARAQKGDRAGARRHFERLLEAEPDAPGHLNNFALFELEGRDYRAAARLFETSLDLSPDNETAARGLGEAARALGDERLLIRATVRPPKP
jgi:spermidine synthase